MNESIVALEGCLGIEAPCFLFASTFFTVLPLDGAYRSLRVRPHVDSIKLESFDGNAGVVTITTRAGRFARIKMLRRHLLTIQVDLSAVHPT
jgi:hypothetical protein